MSGEDQFLQEEQAEISLALSMIEELTGRPKLSQFEVISLGTLVQNVYTGVERILRLRLLNHGIAIERGPTWHKDLLLRASERGLIDRGQFEGLGELLAFRHMHVHGYGHKLKEPRLRGLAASVPALVRDVLKQ